MSWRYSFAVCLFLSLSACTKLNEVAIGYARSPTTNRQAVAIQARHAEGGEGHLLLDTTLRARVGERQGQLGIGLGVLLDSKPFLGNHLMLRLAGGVHVLEAGYVDHAFAFGMGTPYAETGITWLFDPEEETELELMFGLALTEAMQRHYVTGMGLTLSGGVEYDVRFTSAHSNESVWFVTLGLTWVKRAVGVSYPGAGFDPLGYGPERAR